MNKDGYVIIGDKGNPFTDVLRIGDEAIFKGNVYKILAFSKSRNYVNVSVSENGFTRRLNEDVRMPIGAIYYIFKYRETELKLRELGL